MINGGRIQNFEKLATTQIREDALTIVEAGLAAINTDMVLRQSVQIVGEKLYIKGHTYNLEEYKHIYILGFGKASCRAAITLEVLLGDNISEGVMIGITEATCDVIDTYIGTHPKPSAQNYAASKKIEDLASRATEDDLVLVVVSGGGSALLCSTEDECGQGQKLYEEFHTTTGDIHELNTIRKHISRLKGGGLAKLLHPATVVGLIFSDVPGAAPHMVASGPTYLDTTTISDAEAVIKKYSLGEYALCETPKDDTIFEKVTNILLVSNKVALDAMAVQAAGLGYQANIVSYDMYDLQKDAVVRLQKSVQPGTAILAGGETCIELLKHGIGKGGRNDLLALHMLTNIKDGQVFVSVASDGHDNSDSAGGLVDTHIRDLAQEKKLNQEKYRTSGDSYTFFEAVGGLIKTGYLESNVSDLMLLLQENNDTN